jgi:hypothetical protein
MPQISRVMIRSALIWLAVGGALGGLILAAKAGAAPGWLLAQRGAHAHLLLLGWTVQFAIGVGIWILPRFDAAGGRGDLRSPWVGALALNLGVALGAATPLAIVAWGDPGPLAPLAGALELLGCALLGHSLWVRVRPFQMIERPQRER